MGIDRCILLTSFDFIAGTTAEERRDYKEGKMKDVTLNDGRTMTDAEFISKFGLGDAPTDFVATKDGLVLLANGIVDDLLAAEFELKLCTGRLLVVERDYILDRLIRLAHYLPELGEMVRQELRDGREKNDAQISKNLSQSLRPAQPGKPVRVSKRLTLVNEPANT